MADAARLLVHKVHELSVKLDSEVLRSLYLQGFLEASTSRHGYQSEEWFKAFASGMHFKLRETMNTLRALNQLYGELYGEL